ncbi:Flagellar basal body-associated protein FliL [Yoonia tamlensis]|uniref:Flagellar protein FliL n=1 Tax=Yoonia tamlensis TaxID=390270 RepID=A0A1I6HBH6_9RHOB|nr:flagellar basal body-associated FliL family protein [Yoonia tamlensis]SFR51829.1 Flagellar basal body-associated protein FliL [Yoonia tamlensis]
MKKLLLPLLLLVLGIGGGVGAGLLLAPPPAPELVAEQLADGNPCGDIASETHETADHASVVDIGDAREYAKLNNQFVIPVVDDGLVTALVVMAISLEVTPESTTAVLASEPKLRDAFLQVMFNHANIGGFSGNFTTGTNMRALRTELLRNAQRISGESVTDVLITDIVRQDS